MSLIHSLSASVVLFALSFPLSAQQPVSLRPDEMQKKTRELVRQLGDPSFRKRESAAKELLEFGEYSRAALEAASNDPDAEIRERSRRLIPEVLLVELRAKVKAFVVDEDGKKGTNLPGWQRFAQAVGEDAAARKFFAQMTLENLSLLKNLEADPSKTYDLYTSRCSEIYTSNLRLSRIRIAPGGVVGNSASQQVIPSVHELATLLLIGTDEKVMSRQLEPRKAAVVNVAGVRSHPYQVTQLLMQPYCSSLLNEDRENVCFKKLFIHSFNEQVEKAINPKNPTDTVNNYSGFLRAAQNAELKEVADTVEKIAAVTKIQPMSRASAICALAKLGGAKHIQSLAPLLKDDTLVAAINFAGPGGKAQVTQIRDVALGVSIILSGQKIEDYEFDSLKEGRWGFGIGANNTIAIYSYYYFGFEEEENRKKAFQRWDEFKAKQDKREKLPAPKEVGEKK